jgi:hypothetical protein
MLRNGEFLFIDVHGHSASDIRVILCFTAVFCQQIETIHLFLMNLC